MSQPEFEHPLEERVERLEAKADRAKRAQNIEQEVTRATENIGHLATQLGKLETAVQDLLFYEGVLVEVFDGELPEEVPRAKERVEESADIDVPELLEAAEDRNTSQYSQSVGDAVDVVNNAKTKVIQQIRDHQSSWENEIEAARDLNKIIGGGSSEFDGLLQDMENFLDSRIWDDNEAPSALAARWDSLIDDWQANAGMHGWEAFQAEHDLNDSTVDLLKQFAERGSVQLNEASIETIEEMKGVATLESAVRMEIDTG